MDSLIFLNTFESFQNFLAFLKISNTKQQLFKELYLSYYYLFI